MSDYTPTTEEVRTAWYQLTINVDSFDRWLAQVKAEAWDEGSVHGARKCLFAADLEPCPHNPYREETE